MKCINLFGGPCSGKSTTASKLFGKLKEEGYKVEYITEYTKDLVYAKDFFRLGDQLKVLAEQHHKQWMLLGQVDYLIIDGPFLLSNVYLTETSILPKKEFTEMVLKLFESYDNVNYFINRPTSFQEYGRNHDVSESIIIDNKILEVLNDNSVNFEIVDCENAYELIYDFIKN